MTRKPQIVGGVILPGRDVTAFQNIGMKRNPQMIDRGLS